MRRSELASLVATSDAEAIACTPEPFDFCVPIQLQRRGVEAKPSRLPVARHCRGDHERPATGRPHASRAQADRAASLFLGRSASSPGLPRVRHSPLPILRLMVWPRKAPAETFAGNARHEVENGVSADRRDRHRRAKSRKPRLFLKRRNGRPAWRDSVVGQTGLEPATTPL